MRTTTATKQNEKEQVEGHRRAYFQRLLNGNVPNDDIEALTRRLDISPHDVDKLLKQGCSPEFIIKILL